MGSLTAQAHRVQKALAELKQQLHTRFGERVVELKLFGSRARGQANAESDVDVLVVLDQASWQERREIIDSATDIGLAHDVLLSPTVIDQAIYDRWREQRRPLIVEIERDGIPL